MEEASGPGFKWFMALVFVSAVLQNLFPYGGGGPQYPPQIYGGPGTLGSPVTAGPVYPGFTTQSLQGGPVYPVPQYGVQTPHLVRYSPTGLPQAYVPISTPAPPTGK